MDQDKKTSSGAPSSDTTSALFVSARKKQLEQQEAERRAKEKEDQRLAAEAEVRRLEKEVEERKRRAEEEAKQAEEDAKRIAEEARAKKTQAAENPDAVLGTQTEKKEIKLPKISIPSGPKSAQSANTAASGGEAAAKAPPNKKMLAIIGGAVAVVVIAVIAIFAMRGGGASEPAGNDPLDTLNEYDIVYYMDNGSDIWYGAFNDTERVQTAEHLLGALKALGENVSGFDENSLASAINDLYDADNSPSMWAALCKVTGVDGAQYIDMLRPESSASSQASSEQQAPAVPAGFKAYENTERGISFHYPQDWSVSPIKQGDTSAYVDPILIKNNDLSILMFNYTGEYQDYLAEGRTNFQDFLERFVNDTLHDLDIDDDLVSNASFNKYDEYADGSKDQGFSFNLNKLNCFAAARVEGNGVAHAVLAIGLESDQDIDNFNAMIHSIVISNIEG